MALRQAVEVDAGHRWREPSATQIGPITGLIADEFDVEMVVWEPGLADWYR